MTLVRRGHQSINRGSTTLAILRIDPVHRITLGDRLELGQRCAYGEREVLSAARRDSHVLAEDWCPPLRRHRHEVNRASASLADNGVAMRRFDVFRPVRVGAEHRYQVTFALQVVITTGFERPRPDVRPWTRGRPGTLAAVRGRTTSTSTG
jgi:transposase InsO family protein